MKVRPLPLRSKAPQGLQEIWDSTQRKLSVLVVEADDNVTQKDKSTLSVTLTWGGKIKQQTSQKKKEKAKHVVWNEYFIFGVDSGGPELTVEVFQSKKLGRDESLGSGVIFHLEEPPAEEKVVDIWVPLEREAKKKKDKVPEGGKIRVRILYSCSPETRPMEERGQQVFFYDDHIKQFKTGDLVLYSGIGLMHSYNKLITNSDYSHAGMIFRLPNKWTRRDDVYVLEVTRNSDGFLDGFLETPNCGISLFRFFERLHQFHGLKIWYCPITPSSTFDSQLLVTEMWRVHGANVDCPARFQISNRKGEDEKLFFLEREIAKDVQAGSLSKSGENGESSDKGKNLPLLEVIESHHFPVRAPAVKFQLIDLLDGNLLTYLLRRGGMGELSEKGSAKGKHVYPANVAEYKCYGQPILLRDVDLNAEHKEKSEEQVPQQYFVVQNPMMPMPFMPMMPQGQMPMMGGAPMMPQQGSFMQPFNPQMLSPMQQHQMQQMQLQQQQQQQQLQQQQQQQHQMQLQQQQQQQLQQQQLQQQQLQQQQLQQQQLQQQQLMQQRMQGQQTPQPQSFPPQPYNPFQPPPMQARSSLENLFTPQPLYPAMPEQAKSNPPPFNPEYIEDIKAATEEVKEKRRTPQVVIH